MCVHSEPKSLTKLRAHCTNYCHCDLPKIFFTYLLFFQKETKLSMWICMCLRLWVILNGSCAGWMHYCRSRRMDCNLGQVSGRRRNRKKSLMRYCHLKNKEGNFKCSKWSVIFAWMAFCWPRIESFCNTNKVVGTNTLLSF